MWQDCMKSLQIMSITEEEILEVSWERQSIWLSLLLLKEETNSLLYKAKCSFDR